MRIKKHSPAFVIVHVDGRVETEFPDGHTSFFDRLKLAMIEGWVKVHAVQLKDQLKPGNYGIKMSRASLFARNIDFDLFEV